jgi:hypothetical protein
MGESRNREGLALIAESSWVTFGPFGSALGPYPQNKKTGPWAGPVE